MTPTDDLPKRPRLNRKAIVQGVDQPRRGVGVNSLTRCLANGGGVP